MQSFCGPSDRGKIANEKHPGFQAGLLFHCALQSAFNEEFEFER